jgi:hypothetical protein
MLSSTKRGLFETLKGLCPTGGQVPITFMELMLFLFAVYFSYRCQNYTLIFHLIFCVLYILLVAARRNSTQYIVDVRAYILLTTHFTIKNDNLQHLRTLQHLRNHVIFSWST